MHNFEIDKFYILPNLFYIFYFRQNNTNNINMSDNEQEVTEHMAQHQDNASSDVVQQIEKFNLAELKKFNSTKIDKFASILQTSLSQFTTSLRQLLINQTSKRQTEEDHSLQENQQKGLKLMLNAQSMKLHVLNTWTGL